MAKKRVRESDFYNIVWGGPVRPDPDGLVLVRKDTKGFNEYRFNEGKTIKDWPEGITFFMEGKHHEDYLVVGLQWVVVSDKVKKVFEECNAEGVQFLPVNIIIENTGKDAGPYWAMNVFRAIDALDWVHTVWVYPERIYLDEHPQLNILKEALRREPLAGVDAFHLVIGGEFSPPIYISKRVKVCMEQAGATSGFKFNPVPVY